MYPHVFDVDKIAHTKKFASSGMYVEMAFAPCPEEIEACNNNDEAACFAEWKEETVSELYTPPHVAYISTSGIVGSNSKSKNKPIVQVECELAFPYKIIKPVDYEDMIAGEKYLVRPHRVIHVIKKNSNYLYGNLITLLPNGQLDISNQQTNNTWSFEEYRPLLIALDHSEIPSIKLSKILMYGAMGVAGILGLSTVLNLLNKSH